MNLRKVKINVNKAIELKKEISELTKQLSDIKVQLIVDMSEEMDNKNLKYKAVMTKKGYVSIADKSSYEVTNRHLLVSILGEQAENYVKVVTKKEVSFDDKFMEALDIAVNKDYCGGSVEKFLETAFNIGASESRKIKKKLKGKYIEDFKLLSAIVHAGDGLEEEINEIRLRLNYEKMIKYVDVALLGDENLLDKLKNTFVIKETIQTTIKSIDDFNTTADVE